MQNQKMFVYDKRNKFVKFESHLTMCWINKK